MNKLILNIFVSFVVIVGILTTVYFKYFYQSSSLNSTVYTNQKITTENKAESSLSGTNNISEKEAIPINTTEIGNKKSKTLIVYFSKTGNTIRIAEFIQLKTSGELVQVVPKTPYPDDYRETTKVAKKELEDKSFPEILTKVPNLDVYDTIFIGYPNWWGHIPRPMATFLKAYDFSGKTVIPFCTHLGSGFGSSLDDIKEYTKSKKILEGLAIWGTTTSNSQNKVDDWIDNLGINKN